jgi:hypothetical protein
MSKSETQDLLAFVRQLPVGIAYAPIYRSGAAIQSGKISKGKTPLERSHHQVMTPADVALQIERKSDVFKAVGAFTGARSGGLVILDVDRNLARLKRKWGSSLEGAPKVESTKSNAAKYLFRVPEALWGVVKGFGLSERATRSSGGVRGSSTGLIRAPVMGRLQPVSMGLRGIWKRFRRRLSGWWRR